MTHTLAVMIWLLLSPPDSFDGSWVIRGAWLGDDGQVQCELARQLRLDGPGMICAPLRRND